MTEEEAKKVLFKLHQDYMNHTREERLNLYDDYQKKRNKVKEALASTMALNKEFKNKKL